MMGRVLFMIFMICSWNAAGQGIIRGKITDDTGESLIGVAVVLKSDRSAGVISDFDGNYSVQIRDSANDALIVSYIGYQEMEWPFLLKNGEIRIKNFIMKSSSSEIGEVEITAKAVRSNDYYMEKIRMNSAVSLDFVSSETMKKTGDASVVSALSRVTGVSTNSGFITVRGIGDRYVRTGVNGMLIPTLDPFTNNIKLDMFPSSLADNIIITKTASPDLPADWSGAYISVETKDFPDQLTLIAESSFGYNNQSTFKEVLSSNVSSTDWLGYDNSYRERDHNNYAQVNVNPLQFDELEALGLQQYYRSMGVNGWNIGSAAGNTYFKLGLVQLGLLAPALFDDENAVNAAKEIYERGNYKSQAFNIINSKGVEAAQAFPNNWNIYTKPAPLDFSQSLSVGNQVKLMKRPLGFIFGFRYGNSVTNDFNGIANRASVDANGVKGIASSVIQQVSNHLHGWSALFNVAYKLNPNNSIALLFMPNVSGMNRLRNTADDGTSQTYDLILTKSQFYEQRKQWIYQIKSDHYFPASGIKLDFTGSYTKGESSAPDFKFLTYFQNSEGQFVIDTKESDTHRYFRNLTDNFLDSKVDVTIPVAKSVKVKAGGSFRSNERISDQYDYKLNYNSGDLVIHNNDFESFFDASQFGIKTTIENGVAVSTIDKYYTEAGNPSNKSVGFSDVLAAYLMGDLNLISRIRFSGGVRVEYAEVFSDVHLYDSLELKRNDPRRQFRGEVFTVNPGELEELSILPSANVIYKIREGELNPVNLRLSYSKTVARPGIRELSDVIAYDYELRDFVFGNSQLKQVDIDNYDLRIESWTGKNNSLSLSFFYKEFNNHIELTSSKQGFSWINVDRSTVMGIELEGSKRLSKNFEVSSNLTVVDSKTEFVQYDLLDDNGVKTYVPVDTVSRAMYGQAPFVVNCIVSYLNEKAGISASLSYNLQGKRLLITSTDEGIPDVYEMPRNMFDVKISKSIGKHLSVNFRIRDVLNTSVKRAYIYDDGSSLDYDNLRLGTSYIAAITYKL